MMGTKSLMDCLRTPFGRIRSKHSSRFRPIQRSFRWLGPSLWWTAYVPFLKGSGPDVIQEIEPIHKVIQMIVTKSLMDCLCTPFERIKSRRSSRKLKDIWSTNVMMEISDQVCMVISKWAYSREILKMS